MAAVPQWMDGQCSLCLSTSLSKLVPQPWEGGISQFTAVKNGWNPAQQDQALVIPVPQTDPQSEPVAPTSRQKDCPRQAAIPAPPYLF